MCLRIYWRKPWKKTPGVAGSNNPSLEGQEIVLAWLWFCYPYPESQTNEELTLLICSIMFCLAGH
jgi:hypothetical protein